MKLFFATLSLVFAAQVSHAELIPHVEINGKESLALEAGKVAELRISFTESTTGQVVTKYRQVNNKYMHLVIMKEDLSTMVHLHPILIGETGQFWTVLNQKSEDPDTQNAEIAIKKPGRYFVIAEVFPDRGAWHSAPQFVRFALNAPGESETKVPTVQTANSKCEYVSFLKADGSAGAFGDAYRVSVHTEVVQGVGGDLVRFHVRIQSWHKRDQIYVPERNLQEFMRMHGHLFIVSTGSEALKDKLFIHAHGMIHPGIHDDHMIFSYFDRGELAKAPALRLWLQFKHNNQVQTAAVTFVYDPMLSHECHADHR